MKGARLFGIVVTLFSSTLFALLVTWGCSYVLLKVGIGGFAHTVILMVTLPLTFAVVALFLARKVLLRDQRG